ncbi:MAG: HDOD domain-containing protein [bacterium]|nr:HDOD domain-containing protein [bacterium]
MSRRDEILELVNDVPKLPAVVARIQNLLQDPGVEFVALAREIEMEPGMTGNVLQMANSAFFGRSREIHSIRQAVTVLGTHRILQMVVSQVAAPIVRDAEVGYGMSPAALWRHSICVALAAEKVAEASSLACEPDKAYTAGLLHDVGKIVLGTFVDLDDAPVHDLVRREELSFETAERRLFGIDHAEISALVLERWQLPAEIVAAVGNHHQPARADESMNLIDIVHVADMLCMNAGLGLGSDGLSYRLDIDAVRRVDLAPGVAELILSEVAAAIEEMEDMFGTQQEDRNDVVQNTAH